MEEQKSELVEFVKLYGWVLVACLVVAAAIGYFVIWPNYQEKPACEQYACIYEEDNAQLTVYDAECSDYFTIYPQKDQIASQILRKSTQTCIKEPGDAS